MIVISFVSEVNHLETDVDWI